MELHGQKGSKLLLSLSSFRVQLCSCSGVLFPLIHSQKSLCYNGFKVILNQNVNSSKSYRLFAHELCIGK